MGSCGSPVHLLIFMALVQLVSLRCFLNSLGSSINYSFVGVKLHLNYEVWVGEHIPISSSSPTAHGVPFFLLFLLNSLKKENS